MAKCRIVEPCIYLRDGKAVHHTEPGGVVELSDAVVRVLGSAVERLDSPKPRRKDDDDEPARDSTRD